MPALRLHPAMLEAVGSYQNACENTETIAIGRPLAAVVQQKLGGVLQGVAPASSTPPEGAIEAALVSKRIELVIPRQVEATYPVTVTIGLDLAYVAADGTTLFSKTIERTKQGQVTVHDPSCEVIGLDQIVKEAAELVADAAIKPLEQSSQVRALATAKASGTLPSVSAPVAQPTQSSRQAGDSMLQGQPAMSAPQQYEALPHTSVLPPSESVKAAPGSLTFRAIMRDESRDQIIQPDEPLTIEIEIKNDGSSEVHGVEVLVGGTGLVIAQLPPTIAIGTVRPGEIKRTTITKPVAGVTAPMQGEVLLSLRSGSALVQVPPVKKFTVLVKPRCEGETLPGVDVEQPPKPVAAFKQPKALVLAIGVGHFRDARVLPLKYAGRDAESMATYLQAITGVANDRVRLLRDGEALKQDLAETFEEWLPAHADGASVLYVFFAGRALVDGETGAVSLVPFDGTTASAGRLYAIRRIEEAVSRLAIQRAILMFDLSMEPAPGTDPKASVAPKWEVGSSESNARMMRMIGNKGLQEAHDYEQARHGLFTYQLLKGLQGLADLDRDGTVVAGELCAYARGEVGRAAREQFGNEQEPLCVPGPGVGAMVRIQPMAKGNNPKLAVPEKKNGLDSGGAPNDAPPTGIGPGS